MPLNTALKIVDPGELAKKISALHRSGRKVVFTNGCFDILHVGHVRYLSAARCQGDVLVVGLNSDASVRAIKGDKRPIVPQHRRAEVLAGLQCVDYITIFVEPDPLQLIRFLQPDVLVKGADWSEKDIIGADFVKKKGGRVARVARVPQASTSELIERIVARYR